MVQKVSKRFAHLFSIDVDEAVVKPMMDNGGVTSVAFTLTNFRLVMRESQIMTAAVNVELFTEVIHRHGRTLDVPTRPSRPPRGVPSGFTRLRCLPKGEILVVSLARTGVANTTTST